MFSKPVKNIFKVSIYFSLIVSIIFLFLVIGGWYHLVIGWIVGAVVSMVGLLLNVWTASLMLSTRRTKKMGRFLGIARTTVHMLYYALSIFFVLGMNAIANKITFNNLSLGYIITPINFFTFIGGLSVVMLSAIIAQIPFLNKKNDKKN